MKNQGRLMRCKRGLPSLVLLGLAGGCFNAPSFVKSSSSAALNHTLPAQTLVAVRQEANGSIRATLDPTSKVAQTMVAPEGSPLAGTSVTFPAGSLAIVTDISLQVGAPISSDVAAKLGVDMSTLLKDGTPTMLSSSEAINLTQPFTMNIKLDEAGLGLDEAVAFGRAFFQVLDADSCETVEEFRDVNYDPVERVVTVSSRYFGIFQPALFGKGAPAGKPEIRQKAVACSTDVTSLPLAVTETVPFVAPGGKAVELHGKNFRPGIKLALGNVPVSDVSVKSDAVVSFTMPAAVPFGFTELSAEQDGQKQTVKLFAQADKTGLPLITLGPDGVCAGVSYIDANGTQQTGTKTCSETKSSTAVDMSKYDSNGDGIIDVAAYASNANSATVALYANGRPGADITVASTLNLPGDGSFHNLIGNGTVSAIANGQAGTRVTFLCMGIVTFQNGAGGTGLMMNKSRNYTSKPGDVIEFVAIGTNVWREISRSVTNTVVVARIGGTPMPLPYSATTPIIFNQEVTDTSNAYNPATGVFTVPEAGLYKVSVIMKVVHTSFTSPSCSSGGANTNAYVYRNGNIISDSYMYEGGSNCIAGERNLAKQFVVSLAPGDVIDVRAYFYTSEATPGAVAVSASDALVIELQ